jgi:hypothetical protein
MSWQHTQGQLHVGGDGTIVYDKDGWGVCNATVFHGRQAGPEVAREHASRLVACWNACEGVSTEDLETAPGYKAAIDGFWEQRGIAQQARAQRDELLAALQAAERAMREYEVIIEGEFESGPTSDAEMESRGKWSSAVYSARAAIANATGSPT